MSDLYNTFHNLYEVVPADSIRLMETAYSLRYQVYCLERSYEDADAFPDRMETDKYDLHSAHSLVRCQKSGEYAGLVRLILPNPRDIKKPLPVEKFCHPEMNKAGCDLSSIPRESVAEISRFSISRELRRQCALQADLSVKSYTVDSRKKLAAESIRSMPHITIGLFTGLVRMSAQNCITHWLALMEPTFTRLLSRYGIYFQEAGPLVEYHGLRQPTVANIDAVLSCAYTKRKDVWEVATDFGNVWPLSRGARHFVFP